MTVEDHRGTDLGAPDLDASWREIRGWLAADAVDESREARRTLRGQIAHLEETLARHRPADGVPSAARPAVVTGPRILDLGDLERVRDDLVAHVESLRRAHADRDRRVQARRDLLAAMLDDPGAHRGVRITAAEIDEPGCKRWTVTPVLGVVGRLAGWWRVRISSGCP